MTLRSWFSWLPVQLVAAVVAALAAVALFVEGQQLRLLGGCWHAAEPGYSDERVQLAQAAFALH